MKRCLALLFILISLPALAAGPNDGIYSVTDGPDGTIGPGFVTIHQNGDVVIMIDLTEGADFTWTAFQGIRVNNSAELGLVVSEFEGGVGLTLEFTSDTTANVTFTSCSPAEGFSCNFEPPVAFTLVRVF